MARRDMELQDPSQGASQIGSPDALFQLGLLYSSGRDVGIDLIAAHKWFNLAAMRGNEAARRYRLEIAGDMTRLQVAQAQRLAREWLSKH